MNDRVIQAYLDNRSAVDVLIEEIKSGLAKKNPLGAVRWSHVGDLVDWREKLQEVSDQINRRGEYAPAEESK
jgi:hypothetical protein